MVTRVETQSFGKGGGSFGSACNSWLMEKLPELSVRYNQDQSEKGNARDIPIPC